MNRKFIILISIVFLMSMAVASANVFLRQVENVTVDVVNVSDGEPFIGKCTNISGGDAVICFNEYRDNVQYSPGVHIDHWYVGNGSEDIYPHATRIISAEVFYKNATGDVISKSQNATADGLDAFPLIDGYEAYRAEIEYEII